MQMTKTHVELLGFRGALFEWFGTPYLLFTPSNFSTTKNILLYVVGTILLGPCDFDRSFCFLFLRFLSGR